MPEKLDELIEILTKNQKNLDSKKRVKLRQFVADLNFSFLAILERIKEKLNDIPEDKNNYLQMFA